MDTDVLSAFAKIISMNTKEQDKYHFFLSSTNLGKGELQCISICIFRKFPFITNDKKAKRFAEKNNVTAWDIPDIMKALWKTGIKSKEEVKDIMNDLEIKDMMVISNKEKLFEEAFPGMTALDILHRKPKKHAKK